MTPDDLANLHSDLRRYEVSESEYEEAATIRRKLAESDSCNIPPKLANTLINYAKLNLARKNYNDARKQTEEAVAIYQKLNAESSDAFGEDYRNAVETLKEINDAFPRQA